MTRIESQVRWYSPGKGYGFLVNPEDEEHDIFVHASEVKKAGLGAMTAEQAYERGQRDMRDRIIRQWSGWVAGELAGFQFARKGVRPRGDVGVAIRARNKIIPLPTSR